MVEGFEWDENKAQQNLAKHQVSFIEAAIEEDNVRIISARRATHAITCGFATTGVRSPVQTGNG